MRPGTAPACWPKSAASRATSPSITTRSCTAATSSRSIAGQLRQFERRERNGRTGRRLRLHEQPAAAQRLRHLRHRTGVRERFAGVLRARRSRSTQRHGDRQADGVTLSRRQPVSVAGGLQCERFGTQPRRTTGSWLAVRSSTLGRTAGASAATSRPPARRLTAFGPEQTPHHRAKPVSAANR